MNKIKIIIATMVLMAAHQISFAGIDQKIVKEDTVEIAFGNNSKIIILVNSKEDLEKLQKYDLNSMLAELSLQVDESEDEKVLVIEDTSGKKFLKDTTIVINERIENDEFAEMEEEFEREFERDYHRDNDDGDNNETYDNWWEHTEFDGQTKVVRGKRTKHRSFMDFGMNNYYENGSFPDQSNAPYSVKPFGSWYVALGPTFQTKIAGKLGVEWGAQVSWYNFKYQDPAQRIDMDENTVFWETSLLPSPVKSKLTVTYLNAVLIPVYDFGYSTRVKKYEDGRTTKYINHNSDKFRIGLGGYIGYKLDSYSKFVWRENGDKKKDHVKKSYYTDNFRYGVRFVMGIENVDLFLNYDMNNLFYEDRGPKLNAFSFGISF